MRGLKERDRKQRSPGFGFGEGKGRIREESSTDCGADIVLGTPHELLLLDPTQELLPLYMS